MKLKKWEEKVKLKDLKCETKKYTCDFEQYETIRYFGDSFYTRKANIVKTEEDQSNLLKNIVEFNDKYRPMSKEGKDKIGNTYESAHDLYDGRDLMFSKVEYFH